MFACCVQGVITYSLSLFFCKLVAYTFLFWLPKYIATSKSNYESHAFDFFYFYWTGIYCYQYYSFFLLCFFSLVFVFL